MENKEQILRKKYLIKFDESMNNVIKHKLYTIRGNNAY